MLGAQLVADAVEGVVVLVAVVDDDGAVQVAVDEAPERGERPLAREVTGEQAGAGDLQVLLLRFRSRPGPDRCLIAADDAGEDDQRPPAAAHPRRAPARTRIAPG